MATELVLDLEDALLLAEFAGDTTVALSLMTVIDETSRTAQIREAANTDEAEFGSRVRATEAEIFASLSRNERRLATLARKHPDATATRQEFREALINQRRLTDEVKRDILHACDKQHLHGSTLRMVHHKYADLASKRTFVGTEGPTRYSKDTKCALSILVMFGGAIVMLATPVVGGVILLAGAAGFIAYCLDDFNYPWPDSDT